jgi:hypothetical protein
VSLASLLHDFLFNCLFHFLFHFLFKLQKCLFYPGVSCMAKQVPWCQQNKSTAAPQAKAAAAERHQGQTHEALSIQTWDAQTRLRQLLQMSAHGLRYLAVLLIE